MTEQEAIAIIKKNYPKCCKMVNGRYEDGGGEADSKERNKRKDKERIQ